VLPESEELLLRPEDRKGDKIDLVGKKLLEDIKNTSDWKSKLDAF
jgi:hypothetical protein